MKMTRKFISIWSNNNNRKNNNDFIYKKIII